jgi:dTDP-4-dehydrorhamnose reductase
MKKVLVLGSTGMLGHTMCQVLSRTKSLEVYGTHRQNASLPLYFDAEESMNTLPDILGNIGGCDYLINCIGLVKALIKDNDANSVRRAIVINALFPHNLATLPSKMGSRVIHISTDGVFSGRSQQQYLENMPHDCVDVYGRTKSLGEVVRPGFLNIRCSIIGPDPAEKKGILEWFLAHPEKSAIVGYTDHLWNGVTTVQLAELCEKIILQDSFEEIWVESPVHHFCPNRLVSKYELLNIFKSVFEKNITIKAERCPRNAVNRVLGTRYRSLPMLFGTGMDIRQAVSVLRLNMRAGCNHVLSERGSID